MKKIICLAVLGIVAISTSSTIVLAKDKSKLTDERKAKIERTKAHHSDMTPAQKKSYREDVRGTVKARIDKKRSK